MEAYMSKKIKMKIQMLKDAIMNGEFDARFKRVYVTDEAVKAQHERYVSLANDFAEIFSEDRDARLFSAPGRTEVGGNHTASVRKGIGR